MSDRLGGGAWSEERQHVGRWPWPWERDRRGQPVREPEGYGEREHPRKESHD